MAPLHGACSTICSPTGAEINGISGASAGAINAVMLADGLARGGPEEARKRLADFWRAASAGGNLPPMQRAVTDRLFSLLPLRPRRCRPGSRRCRTISRPTNSTRSTSIRCKDLIERFVDFDAVRESAELALFISATNVHTGRLRIFARDKITADAVMASAALPFLFQAVEIDDVPYWDGGYHGQSRDLSVPADHRSRRRAGGADQSA